MSFLRSPLSRSSVMLLRMPLHTSSFAVRYHHHYHVTLVSTTTTTVAALTLRQPMRAASTSTGTGGSCHPHSPQSTSTPSAGAASPGGSAASSSSSSPTGAGRAGSRFTAPPNLGAGRTKAQEEANPYKSWEHMNHTWLILMCMGCLCAGLLAGQFVEVDETKLKPKFRKEDVMESAMKQFEFRPDLAATSIRVAFVLAARRAGFAAGTVDESCAVVDGLGDIAGVFHYLGNTYHASMEDLTSLAAIAAIRYLNGPYEAIAASWRWGRNDSDVAPPRKVPTDPQKKTFSVPTILHGLGDLTDEECVALMACHSVGEFHETVTGLDEAVTHTGKRYTLSNAYYQFLLEQEKRFKPLEVQRTEDNKDLKELPKTLMCTYANVVSSSTPGSAAGGGEAKKKSKKRQCVVNQGELDALLHNRTWRAIVVRFAKDEDAWREAFTSGFVKMIEGNFKRLRVYSDPDSKDGATSATAAQPTSTVSTPTQ